MVVGVVVGEALMVGCPCPGGVPASLPLWWLPIPLPFLLPIGVEGEGIPLFPGDDNDDDDGEEAVVLPLVADAVGVVVVVVVVSRTVDVHGAEVKHTIIASGVPSALPPTHRRQWEEGRSARVGG